MTFPPLSPEETTTPRLYAIASLIGVYLSRQDSPISEMTAIGLAEELNTQGVLVGDPPSDDLRERIAEILTEAYRIAADRILTVSEISTGTRCPACHGKPASYRYPTYRCGCGHSWDLTRSELARKQYTHQPAALLRAVAETGVLPESPAKIARGGQ